MCNRQNSGAERRVPALRGPALIFAQSRRSALRYRPLEAHPYA